MNPNVSSHENRIIVYEPWYLGDTVDALRDILAAIAGPALVTRPANPEKWHSKQYVYWQGRKLSVDGLEMLLREFGIEFRNERGNQIKPPRRLLRVFLSVSADFSWFSEHDGEFFRRNNPIGVR